VQRAVLALVVRQYNTNLSVDAEHEAFGGMQGGSDTTRCLLLLL